MLERPRVLQEHKELVLLCKNGGGAGGIWELAKQTMVDLVVINPSLVLGPLLQTAVNASTWHIAKYLDGSVQTYTNAAQAYVHVQDVANAHVHAYETPGAHGRYLCAGRTLHRAEVCRILAKFFPEYLVPIKCKEGTGDMKKGCQFSSGSRSSASASRRQASASTTPSPAFRTRAS